MVSAGERCERCVVILRGACVVIAGRRCETFEREKVRLVRV
jgi:hypothetical protein